MKVRHLLSITDISKQEFLKILKMALKIKKNPRKYANILSGKTLVMIFEKPSLRTRVSFETGMTQFGGHAIYLAPTDIGLGVRESTFDTARVLSRMSDIIMARTFAHSTVKELSKFSEVPVINALSDLEHPCQVLADFLTIYEKKKKIKGIKLAFVGDGENNVTHSLALASGLLGVDFRVASPEGYKMLKEVSAQSRLFAKVSQGKVLETNDPREAVKNADVVYTDTWISMGDEAEKLKRLKVFKKYQVTSEIMKLADKEVVFMHDMPVYRGNEASQEVVDSNCSIIIDQAENRLHVQKALICFLLNIKI